MIENSLNINAFVLAGLTILLFIVHAILHANEAKTRNDFFFAGSSLNKDGIAANLSATSSSLGTALLFLLFQTPVYGIFISVKLPPGKDLGLAKTKTSSRQATRKRSSHSSYGRGCSSHSYQPSFSA